MSHSCQFRTRAPQQSDLTRSPPRHAPALMADNQSESLRSPFVDDEFQLSWKLHRQIAWVGSFENLVHIRGRTMKDPIADQTARIDMVAKAIDCWQSSCGSECGDPIPLAEKHTVDEHDDSLDVII